MDDYHHDLIENQSRPLDGDSTEHIHSSFDADDSGFAHPTLFTHTYGDLGLAASIFRIKGTPSPTNWPVSSRNVTLHLTTTPPDTRTVPHSHLISGPHIVTDRPVLLPPSRRKQDHLPPLVPHLPTQPRLQPLINPESLRRKGPDRQPAPARSCETHLCHVRYFATILWRKRCHSPSLVALGRVYTYCSGEAGSRIGRVRRRIAWLDGAGIASALVE